MKSPLRWMLGALAGAATLTAGLAAFTYAETRRVERLVPIDGKFLEVEGARLHYVDRGKGQPIVMIHGLGGQLRNFNYLVDLLDNEFRIILVDRPGSGYSTIKPGTGVNLRSQARITADFLDKLGLEKPLVVGHSLGGAIALALGLDFPEKVGGLALIAPLTQLLTVVPDAFKGLNIESPAVLSAIAWTMVAPMSRWGPRDQLEQVFAPDPVPKDFDVRAGGLLARRPANFRATAADMRASPVDLEDLIGRYASLPMPVRMLFGKGDTILDPEVHGRQLLAALPNLQLDLVEGGHMLPVTAPEATAEWIAEAARALEQSQLV